MHRKISLGLLYCIMSFHSVGQLHTSGIDSYDLNGQVYYFMEVGETLSKEEALHAFRNGAFTGVGTPGNNVNFGYTDNVYWLAFEIYQDNHAEKLEVGIVNSGVYRLDHFQFAEDGQLLFYHGPTGKYFPYYSRYIDNRHYYFPVKDQKGNKKITVLFRVDMRGNDFYAPMRLVTSEYRVKSEARLLNFYFLLEGFFACILFIGLMAILVSGRWVYIFYFLYTFSFALYLFACSDWDFKFLYPSHPSWAVISSAMYIGMTTLFMLLFSMAYLEIKKKHPLLIRTGLIVSLCILLLLLVTPFFYSSDANHHWRKTIYVIGGLVVCCSWLLQFYMILTRVQERFHPAYIYASANIPVITSFILFVLHSLGAIKQDDLILPSMMIALGIEILVMCVTLIYQLNSYRLQHAQLTSSLYKQELVFKEQLICTLDEERKRIAEDLHDELGSSLAALKLRLQKNKDIGEPELCNIVKVIDKASADTRNISHNLMPPEFAETELLLLLSNFYNRLSSESGIQFHFHHSGKDHRFVKNEELLLYRIVMEITTNILKHSNANEATIQFIYYDDYLEIMAEDNGKGVVKHEAPGIGLRNIQSRINYMAGEMKIDAGIYGTTIIIRIPYKIKTNK